MAYLYNSMLSLPLVLFLTHSHTTLSLTFSLSLALTHSLSLSRWRVAGVLFNHVPVLHGVPLQLDARRRPRGRHARCGENKREFFIDNLLVRVHHID